GYLLFFAFPDTKTCLSIPRKVMTGEQVSALMALASAHATAAVVNADPSTAPSNRRGYWTRTRNAARAGVVVGILGLLALPHGVGFGLGFLTGAIIWLAIATAVGRRHGERSEVQVANAESLGRDGDERCL